MKNVLKIMIAVLLLVSALAACSSGTTPGTTGTDKDTDLVTEKNNPDIEPLAEPLPTSERTMKWPEGQVFPTFSKPKEKIIAFPSGVLSELEMAALSCMEGLVNAVDTRMVILEGETQAWLSTYKIRYTSATSTNAYDYIKDLYKGSVAGVVLYSTAKNEEYLNLACSIANSMKAIPLTESLYKKWNRKGIDLPVLADISDLKYTKTVDIYQYLYDNYWDKLNHDVIVVQRTGLKVHMRDLASAVGGAVVHLSCNSSKDAAETKLFKKFLNDMTPGKSMVTGWYEDQERELMTVCSQCGLSCVPADFFSNGTVFAQDLEIQIPTVPDMPALENKIYIAFFLSDGDNIQYDMGAMKGYWNSSAGARGKVAVNWTISPALVDIAPGMMNLYYSSATDKECFVSGPSGLGYCMPMNSWGPNVGNNFKSDEKFTAFVQMTNRYMQQSGLRVVTIWDNLSTSQRKIYSSEGTYLYGLTVQHFTNGSLSAKYTGVTNDMLFIQQTPGYYANNAEGTNPLSNISGDINGAISYLKYNGSAPVFIATQVSVWAYHDINKVAELEKQLSDTYAKKYGSDVVEFVRADHFFNLYYQANEMPFDLSLLEGTTASATSNSEGASLTLDGTPYGDSIWTAAEAGKQSVTYKFDQGYTLTEVALYHAETNGQDASLNTKAFTVEVSSDGSTWKKVAEVKDNTASWTDVQFEATGGTYLRITIDDCGSDGIARIADIDIYGKIVK